MVRHGQASFGKANYDELSERGHLQAYHLGLWLADHDHQFSHVRIGGMHRHQQTLDGIAKAYQERGLTLPLADVDTDLNEFDHGSVFAAYKQKNADSAVVKAAASGETRATGAIKVLLPGLDAKQVLVRDVMTAQPMTVKPTDPLEACMGLMAARNFRHLPVVDAGRVVGVVSIGDVVKDNIRQMGQQINFLETYIKGHGA